ncbi:LamG-like jellyroll fold domain-containing protein [Pedosphaera parvula]|uniref:Immunoglobulin I-set domain protein n=1 Tax=Pedosphaera parvula (strain Ellin514) TaxID=320771 RepID=B9XFJ5_PEDPL|nr:LamG-like jellyroll fold domain-containing protein [Pedosphaera parvula]EEF61359.1 Immunoglobulin I-set domain protein [Pedosphaera parvula Ellin514]
MIRRTLLLVGLAILTAIGCYYTFSTGKSKHPVEAAHAPAAPAVTPTGVAKPPVAQLTSVVAASTNSAVSGQVKSRELDPALNPYAAALHGPGKSKRAWDANFLKSLGHPQSGEPIRFELTEGRMASGTIQITQYRDGELTYVSGELAEPEKGKFFFLTPPAEGKAGKAVGVVELPASQTAYRIEPTGINGEPELWQRRMDEVLCQAMPLAEDTGSTNEVANMPPLRPDLDPLLYVPSYNSNIVSLQSYPGSPAVLLLDFFGGYTITWGGAAYPKPSVSNAQIKDLWKRVAEDYMAFNINVTTDLRVYQNAPATSRQRCVFTPSTPAIGPGAAGVAYIGSWNWGSDTVCWSIYTTGKNGGEVGAHEPGHTLGLSHMGTNIGTNHTEYYTGQGAAPTGWCPIMGAGYYQPVTTFSKGDYANPSNTQDQENMITTQNNNVSYRPDDTGSTLATSRYLEIYSDLTASAEGVIEKQDDTDAFQFTTTGGQINLTASPVGDWADLAVMATLADATDTIIASNNPQTVLSATINTNLPAGTYTFRVTGAGRNNPLVDGFSSYASKGYYSIAGSVGGGYLPTRLSVMEHSANGTVVGIVAANNTNDALIYTIVSGNTSNTFSINANGIMTVANSATLDYARLATNTMYAVQFELFVNIADQTDPTQTEVSRRVVIAVQNSAVNNPIALTGFNASVIAPYTATLASKKATAFDIPNNIAFYEAGLNGNAQVSGSGGNQGLPGSGTILSPNDGTVFQLGPYGKTNVLMLGSPYPTTRTLTFLNPQAYNSLSILASSANGGGLGTFVITFTNGSTSQVLNYNAQDWFNNTGNVGIQGFGRLQLNSGLFTEDNGSANPNLYQTTIDLSVLGLNQAVASIAFTKPAAAGSSGIFAVSGVPMPAQVSIAKQPVSVTNQTAGASSIFTTAAMGTPPLGYQWYSGTPGSETLLPGQNGNSLTVTPVQVNQITNYYVVVTNSSSAATSSVATLTVYRSPVIVQQPGPTNSTLFTGGKISFSLGVTASTPVTYSLALNGANISSSASSTFNLNNLQAANAGNYTLIAQNSFGSVTSRVVSVTVQAAPTNPFWQNVLANNPMGYWRLDEKTGTIAHDYVAGNNGTFNSVTLNQPGNNTLDTHTAVKFGPAINSYVGGIPIDFSTTNNPAFSVEAWVKGAAQSTDAGIVTRGTGSGGEQFNLDTGGTSHAFRFFVRDGASSTARLASGNVVLNNAWHHVVGVCDEPNGIVVLYVDGVSNAAGTIPSGSGLKSSANAMTIGSRQSGTTAYDSQFNGSIEEVAVYNYALSAAQVQAHFGAVTNRSPSFLVNPFTVAGVTAGQNYSVNMATNASDPNADTMTFSKLSGPGWLTLAGNGLLSGMPVSGDVGTNVFLVKVADPAGAFNTATMNLVVAAAPLITSTMGLQGSNVVLNWTGGIPPYRVLVATNLTVPISWQNFGAPVSGNSLSLTPSNDAAFYQIQGQ